MTRLVFLIFAVIVTIVCSSEVVDLNSANFEHLTQAATGATTGDWLIKFYAPWCGHCKTLAPVFDEVAEELKGVINVARVDCTQNSDIGSRFDIKGFPTLKLLTKGKVYTFKGRRSLDDIVAFAKGGYAKQDSEEVPRELGFFGKIAYTYSNAFKQAKKDILSGDLFSMDVLLVFLPVVLVLVFIVLFMLPIPDETAKPKLK